MYTLSVMVDGIVTEFPATTAAFFKSPCNDPNLNLTCSILPANPGSLLNLVEHGALPPAEGPAPVLEAADTVDPPLPPVIIGGLAAPTHTSHSNSTSDSMAAGTSAGFCLLVAGFASLVTEVSLILKLG